MSSLPGPEGPIAFERDVLGYPRMWVASRVEGAFALGYLHAVDRLVQAHFSLALASGRLMEFIGDRPIARCMDRTFRRLDLARDAAAHAASSVLAAPVLRAYCDGFNAGARTRGRPLALRALGMPLETWTPATVVTLGRLAGYLGLSSLQDRVEQIVASLAAEGAPHAAFDLLLGEHASGIDLEALRCVPLPEDFTLPAAPGHALALAGGSNAWAVAGRRSASGGALLACDFHLEVGRLPPNFYAAHLTFSGEEAGPEYLQGMTIPGLPVFATGRTPRVAWGCTNARADTVDMLIEECRGGRARAGDQWLPLRRREELVRIRGRRTPERWVYYEHDWGVIDGDASQPGRYLCTRWTGREAPGALTVETGLRLERAATAEQAATLLRGMPSVALHYVLADADGNVAYTQSGRAGARPSGWSGAWPRPAWHDADRRPELTPVEHYPLDVDPAADVVLTANERHDGPRGERLATVPAPAYRAERIRSALADARPLDLTAMAQRQYDEHEPSGPALLAVWGPLLPNGAARDVLLRWAATQGRRRKLHEEAPLRLLHALHREATIELLAGHLGDARARRLVEETETEALFQEHLDAALLLRRPALLDESGLRALLERAWPRALALAASRDATLPPVRASFGSMLLQGHLARMLGMETAPLDLPGSAHAPFQTRFMRVAGENRLVGPALHVVFDMSQPGGFYNIPGGASERRRGAHRVALDSWRHGRFHRFGDPPGEPPSGA